MVFPAAAAVLLPDTVRLVVFDFDGVMTDNRVWVDEEGHEMVAAYRSDSMGLHALRAAELNRWCFRLKRIRRWKPAAARLASR